MLVYAFNDFSVSNNGLQWIEIARTRPRGVGDSSDSLVITFVYYHMSVASLHGAAGARPPDPIFLISFQLVCKPTC